LKTKNNKSKKQYLKKILITNKGINLKIVREYKDIEKKLSILLEKKEKKPGNNYSLDTPFNTVQLFQPSLSDKDKID
jgi:hypothetical protein